MIDYATWAAIGDGVAKHLTAAQRISNCLSSQAV
jgi:hypothetical protein